MNNTINEENIKIPYKFDSKYISEDSIQRIVRLINDKKIIELLIMNTKLPYIFSDNKDPIIFNYDLKEKTSYDTDQEITWLLTCNQIPTPINMTFNLILFILNIMGLFSSLTTILIISPSELAFPSLVIDLNIPFSFSISNKLNMTSFTFSLEKLYILLS